MTLLGGIEVFKVDCVVVIRENLDRLFVAGLIIVSDRLLATVTKRS